MTSPDSADRRQAQARLSELRQGFSVRLRARLDELEALLTAARSEGSQGTLAEAIAAAHRLAGTAGSYGFVAVGEAAGALERALQQIAGGTGGADPWDAVWTALGQARAGQS